MMPTRVVPESSAMLRLRLEWGLFAGASLAFVALGSGLLQQGWPQVSWWLGSAAAALTVIYHLGTLWKHLGENRPKDGPQGSLYPSFGLANRITITRAILVAWLVGLVFGPRPTGMLAWAPSLLFLASALMDFVDGYAARVTRRTTVLGERLDMQWDSVGVLAASFLAVLYGQAPALYALIGLARYLYVGGLWLHRRRGGAVRDLPPSRFRRAMSGMQMGFLAVVLMPLYGPPETIIAGWLFMAPTLAGFARDFLVVTGRIAWPLPVTASTLLRRLWAGLGIALPLALRAGLAGLLGSLLFTLPALRMGDLAVGVAVVAGLAVLLGAAGRAAALAALLLAGFAVQAAPGDLRLWALLLGSTLLFMTGTGKYSLWKPEEWLIDHRAGEA
jgi:CDP-diacylglycerol--glycerol-3-phosphate 3-phosphatidyltransferase